MARFKFKKLKVKPRPSEAVREKVNLKIRKPPNLKEVSLVRRPARKPPAVVNVIKPRPKPKVLNLTGVKSKEIAQRIAARERYREQAGVVMDSCFDNLEQLTELATMRTVTFPNEKVREIPTFAITELGGALNTSGATVTRWLKRGMLPEPFLETSRGKVYHIEEARSFVRLIGKHQREFRQYRDDHTDLRDEIFKANAVIRRGLFSPK